MKQYLLFIISLFLLIGCQKDVDKTEIILPPYEENPVVFIQSSIIGQVIDDNGDPIAQVTLIVDGNSSLSDDQGRFRFRNVEIRANGTHISASKSGYFKGGATCYARAENVSYTTITLSEKGAPISVPSNVGGTVQLGDATLKLAPNSVVKSDGSSYNGNINLHARYIDPLDPELGNKMPASLTGIDSQGEKAALSTFGTLEFELEDMNGNPLELAPGEEAELTFPVPPELQGIAPPQAPVWLFDIQSSYWYEGGDTCYYFPSSTHYSVNCSSPGTWSCCIKLQPVELSQTVYNSDGTPASYLLVQVTDLIYNFVYWGYTDSTGYWQGTIPEAIPLQEKIEDHCAVVLHDEPIGSFSSTTQLSDLTLPATTSVYAINVSGVLTDCAGAAVQDGHVSLFMPGQGNFIHETNSLGLFDFDVYLKCVQFPDLEVRGYDNDNRLRTTVTNINMPGNYGLGAISACDAKDDYLLATIDGTDHHYFPVSFGVKDAAPDFHIIEASGANGSSAKFEILNYSGVGIYNQINVSLSDNRITPPLVATVGNVEVNVTLDDGIVIEGTIQGVLSTTAGALPITTNFRAIQL